MMRLADAQPVILASGSATRLSMLTRAGVPVTARPASVDEQSLKESFRAEGMTVDDTALALAELKASRISGKEPAALVVGADQMLECNGTWFDKPVDRDHARAHLQALAGRQHRLISAVVVAIAGVRVWHALDHATLTMRPLSPEFMDRYLDAVGDAAFGSVGAYQLEGVGAQLFSRVEGDFFTILGLPLLPLLGYLRDRGVLAT